MSARQKGNCCRRPAGWAGWLLVVLLLGVACGKPSGDEAPAPKQLPQPSATSSTPVTTPGVEAGAAQPIQCPPGMQLVTGGEFWMGSRASSSPPDERPRFKTRVATFCLDRTEVSAGDFERCVTAQRCESAKRPRVTCNGGRSSRRDHPINCVSWHQASAFCSFVERRLPSELEWEYAARGGSEYRRFAWGDQDPDGRTCWKQAGTCKVASFGVEAFGLFDVTGNVWEWTADWFAPYPWPALEGHARVYRGGSWSRRFEKWLSPTLRNREDPDRFGSHLGVRCAFTPAGVACPFGKDDGACRHGVIEATCSEGKLWNGLRCAKPGEPECASGRHARPGRGCVLEAAPEHAAESLDISQVSRVRSAEFDADCQSNYPGRPQAYRYNGGSHQARNAVSRTAGCKNRDVGVGWNSTCCP